jgi:WD40 repeat protein
MTDITNKPSVVNINACLDRQPAESHVYLDFRRYFGGNHGFSSKALGVFVNEKDREKLSNNSCMISRSLGGRRTTFTSLIASLKGHSDEVNSVAVSPDGQHVISGSDD